MTKHTSIHWLLGSFLALFLVSGCSSDFQHNPFAFGEDDFLENPNVDFAGTPSTPDPVTIDPDPLVTPPPTPTPPSGSTIESWEDSFTQDTNDAVDMVWIVDDSGSMSNEQALLAAEASAYTTALENSAVDFRTIVITTKASTDSKLQSLCDEVLGDTDGIITNSTSSYFAECIGEVGANGGGEEGMEALRRALDPDYANGPMNPNFLREGVPLHAVFVSDEEDGPGPVVGEVYGSTTVTQSLIDQLLAEETPNLIDHGRGNDGREAYFPLIDTHKSFFEELKGDASLFTAHAIVFEYLHSDANSSDTCHRQDSTEEVGERYITLAHETGGTVADLCSDWGTTLGEIGLEASGIHRCFQLTYEPYDVSGIDVTVDGETPEAGSVSYQSAGNKICFSEPPDVGSEIVVNYDYLVD